MIVNVINGQSAMAESTSNIFSGMSLAEACGQLQANVSDILNEMNMGILLNEHLYLRENGEDIQYVDESAAELKNKIGGAIDAVIKQVASLWDRLVSWVQDRAEDVRMAFARAGIDKKKAEQAGAVSSCSVKWVGDDVIKSAVDKILSDDTDVTHAGNESSYNLNDFVKTKTSLSSTEVKYAFNVVFNTDRSIIGEIRTAKKMALENLSDLKKTAKSDKDSDQIKKINAASRRVSKQSALAIKLYHANIDGCVHALKAAINPAKAGAKKAIEDANKAKKAAKFAATKKGQAQKAKEDADADELNNYWPSQESAIFTNKDADRFFKV